jgi:hypothetical protein
MGVSICRPRLLCLGLFLKNLAGDLSDGKGDRRRRPISQTATLRTKVALAPFVLQNEANCFLCPFGARLAV